MRHGGGHELSVREWTAVHDGRDAGSAEAQGADRPDMLTVAYLANAFPSPVEPYVGEEIEELRRRGVARGCGECAQGCECRPSRPRAHCAPEVVLQSLR